MINIRFVEAPHIWVWCNEKSALIYVSDAGNLWVVLKEFASW